MVSRSVRVSVFATALLHAGAHAQSVAPPPEAGAPFETPLAPLPGLGVDWPDLSVRDPLEIATDGAVAATSGESPRYGVRLLGVDGIANVSRRFDELSVLVDNDGRSANAAQIDRRAREDVDLLTRLMRSEGYYDSVIDTALTAAPADGRILVTLTVTPGKRYVFDSVKVDGLAATELVDAYPVRADQPVVAADVIGAQAKLAETLGRRGYPFAVVPDPGVTVDRESGQATLALTVDPGGKRNFGAIRVLGAKPPFDARHAQVIARFRPGDLYDSALVDDLRRAFVATGLIGQARVDVVEGTRAGTVDIAATLEPAPYRTIAAELGYGTGEGFRIGGSWQHRNLIRPEGAVTLRGVLGTREQLLGATLRMGNFQRRDQVLNARLLASRENLAAYDATTIELAANFERQTTILWQKPWTYSFGVELLGSRERNVDPVRGTLLRRDFLIGAVPLTLAYDGSDDLLDPTSGFRLSGRLTPELALQQRSFGYVRAQFDGSIYQPIGARVVMAARARVGVIGGAAQSTIAPSRLFYSGGGGSVRGYGFQLIGPRNVLGQPVGGRSLAEFSLEARVRLPAFGGNFGVVPFVDGGNVYKYSLPTLQGLRYGAGVGLRYYSNFGPIRIDVGTPIGRRPRESLIAVQVSLGQAF